MSGCSISCECSNCKISLAIRERGVTKNNIPKCKKCNNIFCSCAVNQTPADKSPREILTQIEQTFGVPEGANYLECYSLILEKHLAVKQELEAARAELKKAEALLMDIKQECRTVGGADRAIEEIDKYFEENKT